MARCSRTSPKYLGRTTRHETMADIMAEVRGKLYNTKVSALDLERKLFPKQLVRKEQETMFYGS